MTHVLTFPTRGLAPDLESQIQRALEARPTIEEHAAVGRDGRKMIRLLGGVDGNGTRPD